MPCNTVYSMTQKAELGGANPKLLKLALEALGYRVYQEQYGEQYGLTFHKGEGQSREYGSFRNGMLQLSGKQVDVNPIKVAYSKVTVLAAAKEKGWQVQFSADGRRAQVIKT